MIDLDGIRRSLQSILPFEWAEMTFMLNALLVIVMLAPTCAALGVKVVNFRMAFFSDAISHSAFTGVVVGFVLVRVIWRAPDDIRFWDRVVPPITLVVFGLLVASGITALKRRTELPTDTVIGVFFATVIAGGIAIMSRYDLARDFNRYLYGSILTTSDVDILITAGLVLATVVFLAVDFNRLMLIGLNDALAASRGVATRAHEFAFACLLALVVTRSIRTVGLLLVTAMLVVPAATARNLARSAGGMFRWSALIGLLSGVIGLVLAYTLDTAAGASIILCGAAAFAGSIAMRRGHPS